MSVRVRITGDKKLRAQLANLGRQARDACAEVVEEWADDVQNTAEQLVPVDTHYLQTQIEDRVDTRALGAEVGIWDDEAYYARFVEHGTSSMEAQPFLLPAFEQHRNIRPSLRAALDRYLP